MEKLVIHGKTKLVGKVKISGAKNSAVAILPATLLINGVATLENVPNISDVKIYCEILEAFGSKIERKDNNTLIIDNRNIDVSKNIEIVIELTRKFRASYYLLGALLGRVGNVQVGLPGGCNLGARPIDQHIKAFEALGAEVSIKEGKIKAIAKKLVGTNIYLDIVSVGSTINAILVSVLAEGVTVIENVAKEPHIVDVANFLNRMGAEIMGAGTDVIRIKGVRKLNDKNSYSIVPDQIEAGTFMVAAAASKGDITLENCITKHLESITAKLLEMGCNVEATGDTIRVWTEDTLNGTNITTLPYPGFPTDLQSQMGVLLSVSRGTSRINEGIWDSRFQYTQELINMGANIVAQGKIATFQGVEKLTGAPVYSSDLRAGAALLIAGIIAEGKTELFNLEHIDRGYENIEEKFRNLGANIERVKE